MSKVPPFRRMQSANRARYRFRISTTFLGSFSSSDREVNPLTSTKSTAMVVWLPPSSRASVPSFRSSFTISGATYRLKVLVTRCRSRAA